MRQIPILMPALQNSRPCDLVSGRGGVRHEGDEPERDGNEDLAHAGADTVWVTDAVRCMMGKVERLVD